jgi:hypothetical protein
VGAVAVFLLTRGEDEPARTEFGGQTSRGGTISLTFTGDKVESIRTQAPALCNGEPGGWTSWPWNAANGRGAEFVENGSRFTVEEHQDLSDGTPSTKVDMVLRGEFSDDGSSAAGTIHARAVRGRHRCEGSARWSAEEQPAP